jgi:hypothetical protein
MSLQLQVGLCCWQLLEQLLLLLVQLFQWKSHLQLLWCQFGQVLHLLLLLLLHQPLLSWILFDPELLW